MGHGAFLGPSLQRQALAFARSGVTVTVALEGGFFIRGKIADVDINAFRMSIIATNIPGLVVGSIATINFREVLVISTV